jgi:hypothetical protein
MLGIGSEIVSVYGLCFFISTIVLSTRAWMSDTRDPPFDVLPDPATSCRRPLHIFCDEWPQKSQRN